MFHSEKISARVLRRATDGTWPDQATTITEGELKLENIGLQTAIEDIYRTTWLADSA